MAFPLSDVRLAVRGRGTTHATIHPRLIRDRTALPKIDIAIQHFESMLGQERRAFDPDILVHFFGDHKLARCMVACLSRTYAFRSPTLAEELEPADLEALSSRRLGSPVALRLHVYDFANDFGYGFLRARDRDLELSAIADDLGMSAEKLDRLLTLDAPEHAVLRRSGPVPRAEDIAAQFNAQVLLTLLRHSAEARLSLATDAPEVLECINRLSDSNAVRIRCALSKGGIEVTLSGRQDALGGWGRHGHRLARMLVQILQRGQKQVKELSADIVMKSRRGVLLLKPELRAMLAGPLTTEPWWGDEVTLSPSDIPPLIGLPDRRERSYSLRRLPEPQAWKQGVIIPDANVKVDEEQLLVTIVRDPAQARLLASFASSATIGARLVFVGRPETVGALQTSGVEAVALQAA